MKRLWRALRSPAAGVGLCLVLLAGPAPAASPDPERARSMVRDVTERMLEVLRSEPPASAESEAVWLARKMREIVAPSLDFVTMTKLAVGKHWLDATDEQKRALVGEFKELLLGTYSRSLQEYDNEEIEFLPLKGTGRADRARIRARVIQSDGPEIVVQYSARYRDGEWSVYDVTVDGVSLVTNYRSTFSSQIREDGIDGLLRALREKNADNAVLEATQG